jgi:alpha-beta hydrolase superfamily lysophospholipase
MQTSLSSKLEIKLRDGVTLVGNYYDNYSSNKGVILFPGFTEHKSSLDKTALKLSSEFKVWTFDINSQGESSGNFDLKEIQKSVYEISEYLKNEHNLVKMGGYGNSIGGMAVGLTASETDIFDAICLTSAPAGLQDVVPNYLSNLLKYVPQNLLRKGTIIFDKLESEKNENYKNKSHEQFFENGQYKEYAQFGALKIKNIKDIAEWIKNAPRLDDTAHKIKQPIHFIYGGEDRVLGIKKNWLPKKIDDMYNKINAFHKSLSVIGFADHSLNEKTNTDDCFNQDEKFAYVKEEILNHFNEYLL